MNNSDKHNFAKLLMSLAELHNKKLSEQLLDIYWNTLKGYEFNDIRKSLNKLIVDPDVGQFMPKPADIVRYIDGDIKSRALIAWGKVNQAIRSVGAWDSVEFDDHTIHAIINDMGGWLELCRKTSQELHFLFNEFESRYRGYQYHNSKTFPLRLVGKIELSNFNNHSLRVETKYIGSDKNRPTLSLIDSHEKV